MALVRDLETMRRWRPEDDEPAPRPADSFIDVISTGRTIPTKQEMIESETATISNPLDNIGNAIVESWRDFTQSRREPSRKRKDKDRQADSHIDAIRGPQVTTPAPQTQLSPEQRDAIFAPDPVLDNQAAAERNLVKRQEDFGWGWRTPRPYNPPSVEKEEPAWDWRTFRRPYGEGPLTEQENFARRTMRSYGVQPDVAKRLMEETRIFGGDRLSTDPEVVAGTSGWYKPRTGAIWTDEPSTRTTLHELAHHDRDPRRPFFPNWKSQSLSTALDDEIQRGGAYSGNLIQGREMFGDEHMYQYLIGDLQGDFNHIESPLLRNILMDFYTGAREPGIAWPEAIYGESWQNSQARAGGQPDYFWQPDKETTADAIRGFYPGYTEPEQAIQRLSEIEGEAAVVINDILRAKAEGAIHFWAENNPSVWWGLPREVRERLTNDPDLLGPDENGAWG